MNELFLLQIEQEVRQRIVDLKAESNTTKYNRATVQLDQQSVGRLSRMDAMQQQAMAKANEARRANEVARLQQVLNQLSSGEYGFCTDCGEEIEQDRLRKAPAAAKCQDCARG